MLLFYLVLIFLLFGTILNERYQKLYIIVSFIVLFILAGFRSSVVGTDTPDYEVYYYRILSGGGIPTEIGWSLLNQLVVYLKGDFQFILILSSLLTLFPLYYIFKKYSYNPMLALFLYYSLYIYLQSFNLIRQIIAVSFCLLAMIYLIKNKKLYFILIVIIASTIHISALFCLPLLFVNKINFKNHLYLILILTSLIVGVLFGEKILSLGGGMLGFDRYIDRFDEESGIGITVFLINLLAVFIIFTTKIRNTHFKLFFAYIIINNLLVNIPFSYRIIYYFSIIQVLYLPYYVQNNTLKHKATAHLLVCLYAIALFLRTAGAGGVIPYYNQLFS